MYLTGVVNMEFVYGKKYVDSNGTVYRCMTSTCEELNGMALLVEIASTWTKPIHLVDSDGHLRSPVDRCVRKSTIIVGEHKEPVVVEHWFFYVKFDNEVDEPIAMLHGPYSSEKLAKEYMKGANAAFGLQKITAVVPD